MPVYGMKQFESSKMLFMQNLNDDIKKQNIELYTLYEMYFSNVKTSGSGSCSVVSDSLQPHRLLLARLLCAWNSPGRNTGVGSHSLLQGIFLTQGLNLGLPHCRQVLYCLSHQGSPFFKCILQPKGKKANLAYSFWF